MQYNYVVYIVLSVIIIVLLILLTIIIVNYIYVKRDIEIIGKMCEMNKKEECCIELNIEGKRYCINKNIVSKK